MPYGNDGLKACQGTACQGTGSWHQPTSTNVVCQEPVPWQTFVVNVGPLADAFIFFVQVPQISCIKVLEFGGFLVPLH